ncbi:hypothetical protein Bbelb_402140 [Branchiostoma belcheri]|nr:hypothetical protein Bbelb_402140 [Branchiostoma belcheri]
MILRKPRYLFPFPRCSVPIYVSPSCARISNNGSVRADVVVKLAVNSPTAQYGPFVRSSRLCSLPPYALPRIGSPSGLRPSGDPTRGRAGTSDQLVRNNQHWEVTKATVTTRRTCFCVLSTCKNVGNLRASVRGEYRLRTESYGFGSTQTRRRTLSACKTLSTCGLRIYHPCVRVRATRVPRTAYERATYGLRESNFTILTCNCCTDGARSTSVPRTVLASSVLTPHFPVDLLNDHAEHTCTIPVYKEDLTGDCQLVSKMPRKAQKKTTRQDPKKHDAEDTRAASDDEVNRRCTHLQRASTACTRQRGNRTEIVRCKHIQLTYHLRNVRCTQALTARRVVQTTYVHLAQPCE